MKKVVIAVVVVLLAALVAWRVVQKLSAKGDGAGRPGRGGAVAVEVEPVLHETIRDRREFTGTVSPKSQFLVAPKVAGRVERLLVNIGQEIRNGDPIARLDSLEYEQQVAQARAELDVARANVADTQSALDIANRERDRALELRKQQVASESELDQAEARLRAAQAKHEVALAQVKQREAALKADEIRLSYTQIAAAWEGGTNEVRVVGERYVDEGAMLRANEPMISILDAGTVIATIFVIERDYPRVQVGQRAVVSTDAFPGETFAGVIVRKAPLLKESSRQARVEIEVANADRRLAPGMFVRAGIEFAVRENATVVPAAAVVRRNGGVGVFLADPAEHKAHFVPITAGIAGPERIEVLAPPLEGQVVTLGQHLLEDGAAIILPGGPEAASAGAPGPRGRAPGVGVKP